MDAELVEEIRSKVRPALQDLIAMAAERNLSTLSIESEGIALAVRRNAHVEPAAPAHAATAAMDTVEEELTEARHVAVRSDLVGIFRRTDGDSAIHVGDRVRALQVLAYVESMRLMHEVK